MALGKVIVTCERAAGTADSTLHGVPQICLFMAQALQEAPEGGRKGLCSIRAAGSGSHHPVPAPQHSLCWAGYLHPPETCRMDGGGLLLQAVTPSAHVCGTGRMQDIAGHQTLHWNF